MSTRRKALIAVFTLLMIYLLGGFFAAPFAIKKLILPKVQERLVPSLEVTKIRTNPFLLSASLEGINLSDSALGQFAKVEQARARISFSSLWRFHPVIAEIELTRPELFAVRGADRSLNLQSLLVPDETSKESAEDPSLPKITLNRLSIIEGNFEVKDLSPTREFNQTVGPISFEILDLSTAGPDAGTYNFNATTPDGATITWQGTVNPTELLIDGSLAISDLNLNRTSSYLIDLSGLEVKSANMSMTIRYVARIGEDGLSLSVSEGTYHLHTADVFRSDTNDPVASIKELWIHDISANPIEESAQIGFVEMSGIQLHFLDSARQASAEIEGVSLHDAKLEEGITTVGTILLSNLKTEAKQGTESVINTLDEFTLESLSFKVDGNELIIDSIDITGGRSVLTRAAPAEDSAPGGAEVATSAPSEEPANSDTDSTPEKAPIPYFFELRSLTWSDFYLGLIDEAVEPSTDLFLTAIAGSLTNLSSDPETHAKLDLSSKILGEGPMSVKGLINPFPDALYTDLAVSIEGVDVTAMSSYAGQFLGRQLANGSFSFDLTNKIENSKLSGKASILLDQFELGEKVDSPDAMNLPLDLALILFRDASGKITFSDVSISGDLSTPGFSFTRIVAQAFGNIISKAVTAPFRFLGGALGGDSSGSENAVDPTRVTFDKGSIEVAPDDPSITLNFEFFTSRPLLNFEIQGFYAKAERTELVATKFEDNLLAKWNQRPATVRDPFTRERPKIVRQLAGEAGLALQDADGNALPLGEIETLLKESIQIDPDTLLQLASDRASAVQDAMIARGFAPTDLHLLEPEETKEAKPYVRLGIRP